MNQIDLNKFFHLFLYKNDEPLLFTSGLFLFTFFAFMFFYQFTCRKERLHIAYITLFSLYFYYKASGMYVILLAITTLFNFYLSRFINKSATVNCRKIILSVGLIVNFSCLAYLKYTNFLIGTINGMFVTSFNMLDTLVMPLGISFHTYQVTGYLIDVYRKDVETSESIIEFCFFVTFFPKLLVGPIVRAKEFIPQINAVIEITGEKVGKGLYLIISGLIKKMIIADYVSFNFVDRVFDNPSGFSGLENLMALYGYALQIYCDFSGYTDIAIGIALLMGYKLPINFNSPYQSLNITEFWRRWHISLSFWFRDYIYIPLGGKRLGSMRQGCNIMITMLLCGLWHGASWNFVFWGFLHGLGLIIHKFFQEKIRIKGNCLTRFISLALTFNYVSFGWIFFRADTFQAAFDMIRQIFLSFQSKLFIPMVTGYKTVFILMAIGYIFHFLPEYFQEWGEKTMVKMPVPIQSLLLAITVWLIVQFKASAIQPFIYLQF